MGVGGGYPAWLRFPGGISNGVRRHFSPKFRIAQKALDHLATGVELKLTARRLGELIMETVSAGNPQLSLIHIPGQGG